MRGFQDTKFFFEFITFINILLLLARDSTDNALISTKGLNSGIKIYPCIFKKDGRKSKQNREGAKKIKKDLN